MHPQTPVRESAIADLLLYRQDTMDTTTVMAEDGEALAALRVLAMRESLEAVGRFDPVRARSRFLSNFDPDITRKVVVAGELAAFYMLRHEPAFLFIEHLYVHPDFQCGKIGSNLLCSIIRLGVDSDKDIRLGALKGSRANKFYLSHGFVKTHAEEFDNYYVFAVQSQGSLQVKPA